MPKTTIALSFMLQIETIPSSANEIAPTPFFDQIRALQSTRCCIEILYYDPFLFFPVIERAYSHHDDIPYSVCFEWRKIVLVII